MVTFFIKGTQYLHYEYTYIQYTVYMYMYMYSIHVQYTYTCKCLPWIYCNCLIIIISNSPLIKISFHFQQFKQKILFTIIVSITILHYLHCTYNTPHLKSLLIYLISLSYRKKRKSINWMYMYIHCTTV